MYGKASPCAKSQLLTLKDLESALIELEQLNQEAESVQQLATYNAIVSGAVITPIVGELRKLSRHSCNTCHTAQRQVKKKKKKTV